MSARVLARIGKPAVHLPRYRASDWQERDNFPSLEEARSYARWKSRQYPITPYRVVRLDDRYVVQFVPEWNLKGASR